MVNHFNKIQTHFYFTMFFFSICALNCNTLTDQNINLHEIPTHIMLKFRNIGVNYSLRFYIIHIKLLMQNILFSTDVYKI